MSHSQLGMTGKNQVVIPGRELQIKVTREGIILKAQRYFVLCPPTLPRAEKAGVGLKAWITHLPPSSTVVCDQAQLPLTYEALKCQPLKGPTAEAGREVGLLSIQVWRLTWPEWSTPSENHQPPGAAKD